MQLQLDNFNRLLRTRVETITILDGEDGASGGLYTFDNESSLRITKFGGRGTIGEPRPIGATGLTWLPLIGGHIGYSEAKNDFADIPWLAGNSERYTSYAMGLEAGARIFLTEQISIAPIFGLIYSQTKSSFSEGTATGAALKKQYGGQLVDWYVDTLSLVPSLEVQYRKIFAEAWKVTLTSSYAWFATHDVARSSIYQKISGTSSYWDNRSDLDVRLPLKLFGFPLHTGCFASAGILGDDLREGLNSDAIYALGGRLVVGDLKGLGILNWVGLGVTYFKSNTFSGFSWGLDVSFAL